MMPPKGWLDPPYVHGFLCIRLKAYELCTFHEDHEEYEDQEPRAQGGEHPEGVEVGPGRLQGSFEGARRRRDQAGPRPPPSPTAPPGALPGPAARPGWRVRRAGRSEQAARRRSGNGPGPVARPHPGADAGRLRHPAHREPAGGPGSGGSGGSPGGGGSGGSPSIGNPPGGALSIGGGGQPRRPPGPRPAGPRGPSSAATRAAIPCCSFQWSRHTAVGPLWADVIRSDPDPYSAPMCSPFSATERFMNSTRTIRPATRRRTARTRRSRPATSPVAAASRPTAAWPFAATGPGRRSAAGRTPGPAPETCWTWGSAG